jgi:hypothetical protein
MVTCEYGYNVKDLQTGRDVKFWFYSEITLAQVTEYVRTLNAVAVAVAS